VREQEALIHFRCTNTAHTQMRGVESDTLTIHLGKWAYCPHDIRSKGHVWLETGGQTLTEVRLSQRRSL
jgi:hypothetical protein